MATGLEEILAGTDLLAEDRRCAERTRRGRRRDDGAAVDGDADGGSGVAARPPSCSPSD